MKGTQLMSALLDIQLVSSGTLQRGQGRTKNFLTNSGFRE